jgi:D-alanine-D-alanine ligase
MTRIRRLAVVTGDHAAPDPTKRGGRYNEEDMATHRAMVAALASLGRFDVRVLSDHAAMFEALRRDPPDLVVNFCDTGVHNVPARELHLPAWLELFGIAYTGATPQAMVMAFDKQAVRLLAESLGVETPREAYLPAGQPRDALPDFYPALLKPNQADGSVGITRDALVRNEAEARAYLAWLAEALPGRDVLWQEYLPGPEYGVGLIGNPADRLDALPPLAVDFSGLPAGLAPILSFESKALPDSPYWTGIRLKRADIPEEVLKRMVGWAKLLFARLGFRDYGRFDFRCGADGRPKLMEANPNPAWANDGKLAFMASFAGIPYAGMLEMIVDAAIRRIDREAALRPAAAEWRAPSAAPRKARRLRSIRGPR